MFITIIRPSICGQAPSKTVRPFSSLLRPFSSLLKPQKMKPWMNAPDCDEPTVYVLLTLPKIGFEPPPGATGSLAEERAKVSKRGKSDPKHQRVLRRVGHFIQEAWVE